ncbi:MAG TPA: zinc ribbon domain-containing protein [Anaerolineales bacterium]|jgi:hypothetical protein|nr:zinc ribbon domain-containing protein [Anaerolineales bacterium]
MPKWLVLTLLLGLILFPSSAGAQGETKMEEINIELWSEYDQPSMLVIYEFVIAKETPLPAEVTLRFPNEGNLVAVAVEQDGELFNKDFTNPIKQEDWQTIKIKAESYEPHRVEYYQALTMDGNKRKFKYQWFGDYYAKKFTVSTLIPADSTDLVTAPALETTGTASNGLMTTGTLTRRDLRMMNSFQFELEYQRKTNALTKPTTQVEPAAPVDENTPGRVSIVNLPWIIGGFGLALIGIALFSYWRSTQVQSTESQPRKRRRHKPEGEDEEGQAYCHECGARAHAGDRFCRTCGSRLRVE